jgi:hypothetical protein
MTSQEQRSLLEKINLAANVIAASRQSGASYMVSSKYIYDSLFKIKSDKRIKKIKKILEACN